MRLFYSYSHIDEPLRDKLDRHLAALKRSGVISDWHDRKILAGDNFDTRINQHLEDADIILFLISADFIASSYIWDVEVKRAMERQGSGQCRVIPVVLRPVDLDGVPFENLLRLPKDGLAVTQWDNQDLAFTNIAQGIRRVATEMALLESKSSTSWTQDFRQQQRFLDTAVTEEIPIGESREVLTMVRREDSPGLFKLLESAGNDNLRKSWDERAYSVTSRDVRTVPFNMIFPSSGGRFSNQGVKIQLDLRAPGIEISDTPYTATLNDNADTPHVAFLIRSNNSGKQTLKVRVVCDDQEIISNLMRTSFVQHGGPGGPGATCRFETDGEGRTVLVLAETQLIISLTAAKTMFASARR